MNKLALHVSSKCISNLVFELRPPTLKLVAGAFLTCMGPFVPGP